MRRQNLLLCGLLLKPLLHRTKLLINGTHLHSTPHTYTTFAVYPLISSSPSSLPYPSPSSPTQTHLCLFDEGRKCSQFYLSEYVHVSGEVYSLHYKVLGQFYALLNGHHQLWPLISLSNTLQERLGNSFEIPQLVCIGLGTTVKTTTST